MASDDLIDIAAARAIVLDAVHPLAPERVPLAEALGRVLAEDVAAEEDMPPFDSSALDGYVVGDTSGGDLPVVGESRAGAPAREALGPGQAMRISTGAVVPRGGVAVVGVERAQAADGRVTVPPSSEGAAIRRAGEDVPAGEHVLAGGDDLGPAELGALAALGRADVLCGGAPRVAVLTTGDELVEPGGGPLAPGQIRNSNAYALAAQAERAGARVTAREIVRDTREHTVETLRRALESADVVVVSGGVSVGPHDHVKPALAELGVEEHFWRVALKPGKPTWFGTRGDQVVFGLPGNPVSAIVTFHLFARPALRRLQGGDAHDTRSQARLDVDYPREAGRDQVLRVRLDARPDGWHVAPTKPQGSHVLTSMLGAGAFAIVPRGDGVLAAGSTVDIELLP
jgi:molybdopterin molybdotransferase